LPQSLLLERPGQSDDEEVSSIVRRTLVASRALASRREATAGPRVLTLDADTAVLLAVDATRGMLDACLRAPHQAHPGSRAEAAAEPPEPAAPAVREAPVPPLALADHGEAYPRWRASQARRAYLSTLPPPPSEQTPGPGCDRWA
jgi:hypothetical protein